MGGVKGLPLSPQVEPSSAAPLQGTWIQRQSQRALWWVLSGDPAKGRRWELRANPLWKPGAKEGWPGAAGGR